MHKLSGIVFFLICIPYILQAQELFPQTEPASSIPKGVLGIRSSSEIYNEAGQIRSWQGYKFMFGITPRLSLFQTFTFSNHHGKKLPSDFIVNDGNIGPHTHGIFKGKKYPYGFESLNLYLKYRFLTNDKPHSHFRMAGFLELAGGNEAHDEAEPSLSGDNSGLSAGLISTILENKFAASLTTGFILPHHYSENSTDIQFRYGKALTYNLSFGYLLLPVVYRDYKQTNLNLYIEFMGKAYEGAKIHKGGQSIITEGVPSLASGNYIEYRPSIQFIFRSNTRVDLGISRPLLKRSYVRTGTAYYVNVQHYFFF